jgi:hypothetical protein
LDIQEGDAMNKQLTCFLKHAADCKLVSLLQIVSVLGFMAALHGALAHQGDVPPTLFVLWVVATGIVATVSLAISSSCELEEAQHDRQPDDELHGVP